MLEVAIADVRVELKAQLDRGLERMAQKLPDEAVERLLDYLTELQRWNRAYNLTAAASPAEMVERHLIDSLALRPFLCGHLIVDAGTGAGLPGAVLAIAEPERRFTLVDSNGKKIRFLRHLKRELAIDNIDPRKARVEALINELQPDEIVARALAPLERLVGWVAPWLDRGSRLLAMKGRLEPDECTAVPPKYNVDIHPIEWPGQSAARCVAVIQAGDVS